jgi:hypothetical protein
MSDLLRPLPLLAEAAVRPEPLVWLRRAALAAVLIVSYGLGLLPTWFVLGRPAAALYVAAFAAIIIIGTAVVVLDESTAVSRAPGAGDVLLAVAAGTFGPASAGVFWLVLHFLLGGAALLTSRVFGWPNESDPFAAAGAISAYVAAPLLLGSLAVSISQTKRQLFPARAGVSPFSRISGTRTNMALVVAAVIPGILLIIALASGLTVPTWIAVVFTLSVLFGGAPLFSKSTDATERHVREASVAIARLLRASGYEVISTPRSGSEHIDPLLTDLALYVRSPDSRRAYAIDIVSSRPGEPISWRAGFNIAMNVLALGQTEEASRYITPVLVCVRGTPDSDLRAFASERGIRLIEGIDTKIVAEGLKNRVVMSERATQFVNALTAGDVEAGTPVGA